MNFQQLRSIREAARRNYNLTEVANALFTSQPGVSRQIRELEDELGVVIFERNGKRLTGLTEPGKGILKIIDRLLIDRLIIDLMLAHVPKGMSETEFRYNRNRYMERRREIAEEWAGLLLDAAPHPLALLEGRRRSVT